MPEHGIENVFVDAIRQTFEDDSKMCVGESGWHSGLECQTGICGAKFKKFKHFVTFLNFQECLLWLLPIFILERAFGDVEESELVSSQGAVVT